MTGSAARLLRRAEIALWVIGIALLGVALAATLSRWHYQAEQERALFARPHRSAVVKTSGPAAPAPQFTTTLRPQRPEVTASPADEVVPKATVQSSVPAVKTAAATPRATAGQAAADPTALGRIEIDRVGVAAIVKEGSDEETLSRAVGLVPGSPRPGEQGNIILAGHRDTFFRPLRKIRLNDRIRVTVPPNVYEYRVQSVRVVEPEETSVLESRGVEELTLVTCYPFRFLGPAPERFIVNASRVN